MASRKNRYYIKKRAKPNLTEEGRQSIKISNKNRSFQNSISSVRVNQGTLRWHARRTKTTPSSLVKKAVNCCEEFIKYYDVQNTFSIGHAIESSLCKLFSDILTPGYQIISKDHTWLSATPDCYMKKNGLPVEIKTAEKGSIKEIISKHYHQLQFSMVCSNSDMIIVIVYIINKQFEVLKLRRDQPFINKCLPRLEYSYYTYIFGCNNEFVDKKINKLVENKRYLRYINTLSEIPHRTIITKSIVYHIITDYFLEKITKDGIQRSRNRTVIKNTCNTIENGACLV